MVATIGLYMVFVPISLLLIFATGCLLYEIIKHLLSLRHIKDQIGFALVILTPISILIGGALLVFSVKGG